MNATRRAEIDRLLERLERTRLMIYGSADAWTCFHAAADLRAEIARLERLVPRQARRPGAVQVRGVSGQGGGTGAGEAVMVKAGDPIPEAPPTHCPACDVRVDVGPFMVEVRAGQRLDHRRCFACGHGWIEQSWA